MSDPCPYCDRECPRCRYPIDGGWVHIEQPQAPESWHVVCELKRYVGPMVDVIGDYVEHAKHRLTLVPDGAPSQETAPIGGPKHAH